MSYSLFILSLIGLCAAAIAAFIGAFRTKSRALVVFVPLIALCGSFIYFSYVSVLGFPVKMEWESMPKRITVIYFRIVEKESITLWMLKGNTTRIVELPYEKPAEEGLEKGRSTMGKGIPVTYAKKGKGKGEDGGKGGSGKGKGDGVPGDGKGKKGKSKGYGWRYKIESKGNPIPDGSMPPKF